KPVGSAFAGSNPAPTIGTSEDAGVLRNPPKAPRRAGFPAPGDADPAARRDGPFGRHLGRATNEPHTRRWPDYTRRGWRPDPGVRSADQVRGSGSRRPSRLGAEVRRRARSGRLRLPAPVAGGRARWLRAVAREARARPTA